MNRSSKNLVWYKSLLLVFLVTLSSCSSQSTQLQTDLKNQLVNTYWALIAIDEEATPGSVHIDVAFEASKFRGYNGCNWYGGMYTLTGSNLTFGEGSTTTRLCGSPFDEYAKMYNDQFSKDMTVNISDNRMTLTNDSGGALSFIKIKADDVYTPEDEEL